MKRLLFILSLAVLCGCSNNVDYDSADKIYEVGDVYFHKGKAGIVFCVTDGGRHGKIVSGNYGFCQWASIDDIEKGQLGVFDEDDGMNNMNKIRAVEGWREKFPAFAWCADKGEEWYLPAKNEVEILLKSGALYDRNISLWTSTEYMFTDYFAVSIVEIYVDYRVNVNHYALCDSKCYVRAIAAF